MEEHKFRGGWSWWNGTVLPHNKQWRVDWEFSRARAGAQAESLKFPSQSRERKHTSSCKILALQSSEPKTEILEPEPRAHASVCQAQFQRLTSLAITDYKRGKIKTLLNRRGKEMRKEVP